MRRADFIVLAALTAVGAGCSARGPGPGETGPPLPRVSNLRIEPSDRQLLLTWDVDREAGGVFAGYNIYLAERPVLGAPEREALLTRIEPVNRLPYPGDTDPETARETYLAQDLPNGVRYYAFVRPLGLDGRPGPPTNEVMAICRPGGGAILQRMFSGDRDGFDFSTGRYVNSDAIDCDLTYYRRNDTDYAIAPARIDPLLNETRFWDAGTHVDFAAVTQFEPPDEGKIEWTPRAGGVYVYRTADFHYGKLRIDGIENMNGRRTIRFTWMYQSIPHLIDLR